MGQAAQSSISPVCRTGRQVFTSLAVSVFPERAVRNHPSALADLVELLGHRRAGPRSVEGESVRLVSITGPAAVKTVAVSEHGAVHSVGRLTAFDLLNEIPYALEDSSRLIDVVAYGLESG